MKKKSVLEVMKSYLISVIIVTLLLGCDKDPTPEITQMFDNPDVIFNTQSELKLTLSNPSLIDSHNISVHLNITNNSTESIYLFERWNSWGAYQWWFMVEIDGQKYMMNNPLDRWSSNFRTSFLIEPLKTRTVKCFLLNEKSGGIPKQFNSKNDWIFRPSIFHKYKEFPQFITPVRLSVGLKPTHDEEKPSRMKKPPNYFKTSLSNTLILKE